MPLSRFAECPECRADLHCCRLCRFYDPRTIGRCTHDRAEPVEVKEKSNFCGHFRPVPGAHDGSRHSDESAREALDALFAAPAAEGPDTEQLGDVFAGVGDTLSIEPDADAAKRDLNALFGIDDLPAECGEDEADAEPGKDPPT